MSCTMLLKLLLGFEKDKTDKKKKKYNNPFFVLMLFGVFVQLIADVSLFPRVKWSHYVPGVDKKKVCRIFQQIAALLV